jgi:hypothetical protein
MERFQGGNDVDLVSGVVDCELDAVLAGARLETGRGQNELNEAIHVAVVGHFVVCTRNVVVGVEGLRCGRGIREKSIPRIRS